MEKGKFSYLTRSLVSYLNLCLGPSLWPSYYKLLLSKHGWNSDPFCFIHTNALKPFTKCTVTHSLVKRDKLFQSCWRSSVWTLEGTKGADLLKAFSLVGSTLTCFTIYWTIIKIITHSSIHLLSCFWQVYLHVSALTLAFLLDQYYLALFTFDLLTLHQGILFQWFMYRKKKFRFKQM